MVRDKPQAQNVLMGEWQSLGGMERPSQATGIKGSGWRLQPGPEEPNASHVSSCVTTETPFLLPQAQPHCWALYKQKCHCSSRRMGTWCSAGRFHILTKAA